ncbi:MAG: hypothetical protein PHR20_07670 [Bacteroidales bacterium]|nr:hypothetical protein [Bacteroidales bacterium]
MITNLTKTELKLFTMIYVANIDGNFCKEELEHILSEFEDSSNEKVKKTYSKHSDIECCEIIKQGIKEYYTKPDDRKHFLDEVREVLFSDGKYKGSEMILMKKLATIVNQ